MLEDLCCTDLPSVKIFMVCNFSAVSKRLSPAAAGQGGLSFQVCSSGEVEF